MERIRNIRLYKNKTRNGRWGKKYKDNRNWPEYNEQLVVRGKFFLDLDFVDNWEKELEEMNKGKRGGQYKFPNSLIMWLSVWHQWLDYRSLEGLTRKLVELKFIPYYEDFTTAWYRLHNLKPEIKLPSYEELNVSSDGSGLKMTNGGGYREYKYDWDKKKKKHLIVTITADVRTKRLLGIDAWVEGEGVSEPKAAVKHMKKLIKNHNKVRTFKGDGSFDTNNVFEFAGKNNIKWGIPIRENANINLTPSKFRRRAIREWRKLGYRKWSKLKDYGKRWVGTEGKFSAVKRKFGENLRSRLKKSMIAEAIQRFLAVETLTQYGVLTTAE